MLVDGVLEPVPSWWMLSLAKRHAPKDTIGAYFESVEMWFGALHRSRIAWHATTASTAQAFIDALARRGNAGSTIRIRIAAVLAFYKWAATNRLVPARPFQRDDLEIPARQRRSVRTHPKADFDRIAAKAPRSDPAARRRDELIFECGRFMGLRRKEVTGLTAAQFGALDTRKDLNVIWTDPKTTKRAKSRPVLVPRLFVVKVQNYMAAYRTPFGERRRAQGAARALPGNLFLTARGDPVSPDYVTDTWRRAANAAGIPSRFHNNRSSYATAAAAAARALNRLPGPVVKDLLGHAREETGERYVDYANLCDEMLSNAHIVNDLYERETGPS